MKIKNKSFFLVVVTLTILVSCGTPKDVAYFQDTGNYTSIKNKNIPELRIKKDDILGIAVNSHAMEVAQPFNLPMANYYVGTENSTGTPRVLGYTVDKDGNIDFPLLGKIKAEGLSLGNLRNQIKNMLILEGQMKDPVVTINILNFRVSVLGEVNRPGSFTITGERVTLLEALSMAGDLTIYGSRDCVKVQREINGETKIVSHDLRSSDIISSPYYYLQQNDVIYVEPNKRRMQQSNINQNNSVSVWLSIVSVLLTATSVIVNLSR